MELHLPFSDPEPIIEEVEEQSVLEYAREQGICVDYTTELPRLVDICRLLRDTVDQDLRDPFDDEYANAVTVANQLVREKVVLPVSKETAYVLRTLRSVTEPLTSDSLAADGLQRIRGLKQELPILQTDAELDMLAFGTRVEPDLRDLTKHLPPEYPSDEDDGGFGWPARYFAYSTQYDAKVKSEKLAVTREALELLQSAMCNDFTLEDNEKIMADALESRTDLVPRYLTPPLMPLSPPSSPYIPSSPANRLPLIPESSDSVVAETKALEQQIFAKDSFLRLHSGSSDSMLLDTGDFDALFDAYEATSPSSSDRIPTILKRKVDDLKVEGPLTPPMFSDSPMKKLKSVSFSQLIQVGDSLEPWSDEQHAGTSDSENTMDELLKEIQPVAEEAKRKAENERLTGADTIARVDVPILDFTLPVAPWNEFSLRNDGKHRSGITELEAQMRFLQRVKRQDLKSATAWRGVSDLEFNWGWFASPESSTIKIHEELHGETDFNKIQAELKTGNIAKSSNEVWKRDGLRVLDEDEDDEDEEIEPAEIEEQNDMETLIRKRRLELEEQAEPVDLQRHRNEVATAPMGPLGQQPQQDRDASPYWQRSPVVSHSLCNPPLIEAQKQSHSSATRHKSVVEEKGPTELMFGGFSASNALHKFMESQGMTITPQARSLSALKQPVLASNKGQNAQSNHNAGQIVEQLTQPVVKPIPPFNLPASSLIVSSVLLQRCPLVKEIERLHPNADLIYRDYTLPHAAYVEADIILSPSTGILLTTLQQIKQMPLPGQAARSPVKDRMALLQERYERLVVLVSEGLREENGYSRPEDARDKETLKNIEIFAAQLEGDVVVEFVTGGEQTFAKALVENTAKYGLAHGGEDMGDIKLLPVETTWEVFLRRAGLNPFAAQFIIASLKTPTIIALPPRLNSPMDCAPQRTVEATGLSTFLLMERQDRVKHFQAIMGGRRILDRVSTLLDQRWLSAAHGFRM